MDDAELERLSVKELQALINRIDDAIRASIRAKRLAKLGVIEQPAAPAPAATIDLERERDAWLAARS